LGISGVGTWVLIAAAGIWWQWTPPVHSDYLAVDLLALAALYVLIQAPFDWFGGFYLPRRFGRVPTRPGAWLKGVLFQVLCWLAGSMALMAAGAAFGLPGALAAMAALMLILVLFQEWIARATGTLRVAAQEGDTALVAAADPGFTGGWVGLGPTRRLLMPSAWREEWRRVQRARRAGVAARGARAAGVLVALLFNLTGLAVSYSFTPGAGFATLSGYLQLVFGFTLWSFAGLLTLPSVSRPGVFLADRFAAEQGLDWRPTAQALDRLQDDEPARSPWVERIFHPIPSLQSRFRAPRVNWGAWQAARLALYLSWTVPGLLARSVHCNVGRPDLWVLYPAD
jgi:hypothetical protein